MRLIDADALSRKWQDVLNEKADEKGTVAYITFELFIERLEEEPTIDAVPVVRCKDCKWYMNGKHFSDIKFCCRMKNHNGERARYNWPENGFCSYGVRKTDEKSD